MYDELNRQVMKLLPDGLKRYNHSNAVTDDEIYYFPKLITPLKVSVFFFLFVHIHALQLLQFLVQLFYAGEHASI